MDTQQITITGRWDQGAWHRALMVASELFKAQIWDGQSHLTIHNAYDVHNRLFGFRHEPVTSLIANVDYQVA